MGYWELGDPCLGRVCHAERTSNVVPKSLCSPICLSQRVLYDKPAYSRETRSTHKMHGRRPCLVWLALGCLDCPGHAYPLYHYYSTRSYYTASLVISTLHQTVPCISQYAVRLLVPTHLDPKLDKQREGQRDWTVLFFLPHIFTFSIVTCIRYSLTFILGMWAEYFPGKRQCTL